MNEPDAGTPIPAGSATSVESPPATEAVSPALRPLGGLVGRGSEMGRLLGHLDARRSVRLESARGAGATALLRAVCGEPPRPGTVDGTLALPVGLPVVDLAAVAQRLQPEATSTVAQRHMLVLLDDRDLGPDDVDLLLEMFPRSVLVVTGPPDSAGERLAPVSVSGLSQHHAVGLVEAAMGRRLTIDEGRAAREVATAVEGMPGPLVQAAAAVRDGGLTFDEVLDLLDSPPRPTALAVTLQHALDDDLHVTLSHLRALGDVPATTRVAAAATDLTSTEASRRLRRLAVLGLVLTDGRDGWTAASGIPTVSEPVRVQVAERLTAWLGESNETLTVFDVASVLSALADRVAADDRTTTLALGTVARDRLPLQGLAATTALLDGAVAWATPEPLAQPDPDDDDVADVLVAGIGGLAFSVAATTTTTEAGAEEDSANTEAADAQASTEPSDEPDALVAEQAATGAAPDGHGADSADDTPASSPLADMVTSRRGLALIAVAAAAVIAAVLLVAPSLRAVDTPGTVRSDVDLGVTSVGESTSGTLTLDLAGSEASVPVDLVLAGPDADAFRLDPARCDTLDCRASVTFTPDRSGTHVANVTAVDSGQLDLAVVGLTGSGTGDPAPVTPATNLAVTLFPTEPSPIPGGGSAVLPVGVRNNGPDDSTGARLVVTVPPRVTAEAEGCSFADAALTCPLDELAAGQQERVAVTLTVPDRAEQVRVDAVVNPVTDTDEADSDNAAGFVYTVRPQGKAR